MEEVRMETGVTKLGARRGLVRGCGVVRVVVDEGERRGLMAQLAMDRVLGGGDEGDGGGGRWGLETRGGDGGGWGGCDGDDETDVDEWEAAGTSAAVPAGAGGAVLPGAGADGVRAGAGERGERRERAERWAGADRG